MKKRGVLTLFCAVFSLLPFLCACGRNSALEDGFLPVSVGIDRAADGYDFCFGGYEPGSDGEALYADRTVRTASVTAAFDEIDLSYGMLASLVISPSTAKDGLYPLYAAFIYNDDATEAMALAMSPNPEALLCRTDQDGEDVNAFLQKEQLSCPSVLSYDIAMRTPGETCLVPMIARSKHTWVFTSEVRKADAVAAAFAQRNNPHAPSSYADGEELLWLIDEGAASKI